MAKSSKFGKGGSNKITTKAGKANVASKMAKSGESLARGGTRNQAKGTKP